MSLKFFMNSTLIAIYFLVVPVFANPMGEQSSVPFSYYPNAIEVANDEVEISSKTVKETLLNTYNFEFFEKRTLKDGTPSSSSKADSDTVDKSIRSFSFTFYGLTFKYGRPIFDYYPSSDEIPLGFTLSYVGLEKVPNPEFLKINEHFGVKPGTFIILTKIFPGGDKVIHLVLDKKSLNPIYFVSSGKKEQIIFRAEKKIKKSSTTGVSARENMFKLYRAKSSDGQEVHIMSTGFDILSRDEVSLHYIRVEKDKVHHKPVYFDERGKGLLGVDSPTDEEILKKLRVSKSQVLILRALSSNSVYTLILSKGKGHRPLYLISSNDKGNTYFKVEKNPDNSKLSDIGLERMTFPESYSCDDSLK